MAVSQHNVNTPAPATLYIPTEDYHTKLPIPRPKTLVPPLELGEYGADNLVLRPPTEHQFEEGNFILPGFFDRVNQSWFLQRAPNTVWTYAKRRQAQQILPFLYLGPASAARDRDFIQSEGITLLLSIRDKRSANSLLMSGTRIADELGIQSSVIDVENEQELISLYPSIIRGINQHISSGLSARPDLPPRVLAYCESGNGRSASVVIAYIMSMLNMSMPSALWAVSHRRMCVHLEDSMQNILQSYQAILDAKREVVKAHKQSAETSTNSESLQPSKDQAGSLVRKRSFIEFNGDHTTSISAEGTPSSAGQSNILIESEVEHLKQKPAPFVERVL